MSINQFLCAGLLFSALGISQAQTSQTTDSSTVTPAASSNADNSPMVQNDQPGWLKRNYDSAEQTVENLYDNGRLSMLVSGYAYHGRSTYTTDHLDTLNERAWGLGFSKELRDEKDNEESISFLVIADSHYKPQITAGYAYQWIKPLGNDWEVGIGYTAGLISRSDILGGAPFPGILPLAMVGTRNVKLVASYIPKLSGQNNGDVLFLALRVALK